MKTIPHIKRLCDLVNTEGIGAALKHDVIETAKRHPYISAGPLHLMFGAALLYSIVFDPKKEVRRDDGFFEATIDPNTMEYTRIVRRLPDNDVTVISERKPDGSYEVRSHLLLKF